MKVPDDLQRCADEMVGIAVEHPTDILRHVAAGKPPEQKHQRIIKVGDLYVRMTFTLDTIGTRKMWHLSLKDERHVSLPDEVVDVVRFAFYGEGECVEVPSQLHQGIVRQFGQFVERSDEQRNSPTRSARRNRFSTDTGVRDSL